MKTGKPAIWRRVLQFCAGPNAYEFTACVDHAPRLRSGDYDGLFFGRPEDPMHGVNPEEEWQCDYCREG